MRWKRTGVKSILAMLRTSFSDLGLVLQQRTNTNIGFYVTDCVVLIYGVRDVRQEDWKSYFRCYKYENEHRTESITYFAKDEKLSLGRNDRS